MTALWPAALADFWSWTELEMFANLGGITFSPSWPRSFANRAGIASLQLQFFNFKAIELFLAPLLFPD